MAQSVASSAPQDPQLMAQLEDLMCGWAKTKVSYVVCRLGVPDALQPLGTARTLRDLTATLQAHEEHLYRVLRVASQFGLVHEESGEAEAAAAAATPAAAAPAAAGNAPGGEEGAEGKGGGRGVSELFALRRFRLTPLGDMLRADHPCQMRNMVMAWSLPIHANSQNKLYESVISGKPGTRFAFDAAHMFEIIYKDEMELDVFSRGMTAMSTQQSHIISTSFDFSRCAKVVDVGGARGTLVEHIIAVTPGPKGFNMDRQEVIHTLPPPPPHLSHRLSYINGDFFEPFPDTARGADALLLKMIMHDWGDEECVKILNNCKAALSPEGVIVVIDNVLPDTVDKPAHTLPLYPLVLDLTMMACLQGGKERTLKEWKALAAAAGLRLLPCPAKVQPNQSTKAAKSAAAASPGAATRVADGGGEDAEDVWVWGRRPAEMVVMGVDKSG